MNYDFLQPVFIMGCQRSGSTMLASQLANGDNSFALPELRFIYRLAEIEDVSEESLKRHYADFTKLFRFRVVKNPYSLEEFISSFQTGDRRDRLYAFVASYLRNNAIEVDEGRKHFWIEHSPTNVQDFWLLNDLFPNAFFIHIVRDPRPTYISMKQLPRWNIWDPVTFSRMWVDAVSKSFLKAQQHPNRVIEVKYEDILLQPEEQLKRLCAFIGLPFKEEMLAGGGVRLPKFTQKQHALTQSGVQVAKLEEWKAKIAPKEDAVISSLCGDWMENYDYQLADKRRPLSTKDKIVYGATRLVMTPWAKLNFTLTDRRTPPVASR